MAIPNLHYQTKSKIVCPKSQFKSSIIRNLPEVPLRPNGTGWRDDGATTPSAAKLRIRFTPKHTSLTFRWGIKWRSLRLYSTCRWRWHFHRRACRKRRFATWRCQVKRRSGQQRPYKQTRLSSQIQPDSIDSHVGGSTVACLWCAPSSLPNWILHDIVQVLMSLVTLVVILICVLFCVSLLVLAFILGTFSVLDRVDCRLVLRKTS